MNYTIENEFLTVTVSDMGAELQSIRSKASGEEYLWQGDPAVWSGRSPLLFPVVGRLKDDRYTYTGKTYSMPKHGFARKTVFTAEQTSPDSVSFTLTGEAFREIYPFDFKLEVVYGLHGKELEIRYRVTDLGANDLYFSLGAHPGLRCELGDRLVFPEDENADAYMLDSESKLLTEQPVIRGITSHALTVTKDVFANDALIFKGLRSDTAVLMHGDQPKAAVHYGSAPCLGVWAKPGAGYVCVEPWFGVDDTPGVTGAIEEKPYIVKLESGCTFRFPMTIRIL